jgi:hypothetical protein
MSPLFFKDNLKCVGHQNNTFQHPILSSRLTNISEKINVSIWKSSENKNYFVMNSKWNTNKFLWTFKKSTCCDYVLAFSINESFTQKWYWHLYLIPFNMTSMIQKYI